MAPVSTASQMFTEPFPLSLVLYPLPLAEPVDGGTDRDH